MAVTYSSGDSDEPKIVNMNLYNGMGDMVPKILGFGEMQWRYRCIYKTKLVAL